ncbi:MAG: HIT family protein [Deltaproteobacteria bacterium]|nr:MAG: HIT family protein [Deltaproteobacteria bacterium]
MEDCIFCKIVKGEIPSIKVYEDDILLAFADINPISDGHTLIIPKRHAENIWKLSADEITAIHLTSQKVAQAMKASLNPDGIAFLQLNGRGVNQLVMHYHLHLIPRTSGGPELTMTNWELKQGNMETITATAEKIASAIK